MAESLLRAFLQAAQENERDCLSQQEALVSFVDRIATVFRSLFDTHLPGDPLVGMLFLNAHASFLAAARIALSAQSPPTHMVLRGALESALYGLIASQGAENSAVWLNRDKDPKRSRQLYTAANAIKLMKNDPGLHDQISQYYELAIEHGAHPNRRSVLEHIMIGDESERGRPFTLTYLHAAGSTHALRAIAACIEVGASISFICPHAFPHHPPANTVHAQTAEIRSEFDQHISDHGYHREPNS